MTSETIGGDHEGGKCDLKICPLCVRWEGMIVRTIMMIMVMIFVKMMLMMLMIDDYVIKSLNIIVVQKK